MLSHLHLKNLPDSTAFGVYIFMTDEQILPNSPDIFVKDRGKLIWETGLSYCTGLDQLG